MAPLCSHTGLVGLVLKGRWWFSWTNGCYGQNLGLLIWTKLETPIKRTEASLFSSSKGSVPYMCWRRVHCGVWHWWSNIPPHCTSEAHGKCCLLLHILAVPPSSSVQEETTKLDGTVPHHSWKCKESYCCCCHGPLVLLAMGDSGTSILLTRYECIQLWSLFQNERTTARNNTRDEFIHAIGHSIWNINKDGHTDGVWCLPKIWQKVINKGGKLHLKVHKCCTPVNKAIPEISNCCH